MSAPATSQSSATPPHPSAAADFFAGIGSAWTSVFFLVIGGTYIGIGALAHDFGLGAWWLALSTVLVWAGPAQVILVSALGAGATPAEVAIAVSLSGIRLLPMVVALLPMLRSPGTRLRDLLLPTHFTSISMWIESLRLLPARPRERRIAFCNGLSVGFMSTATAAGFLGFYLAAGLPRLFAGALLFLTPMSFLVSTARNARTAMDRLALVLGLVLGTLLTENHVQLDLLWTGVGGGTLAYAVQRLRRVAE
jgi:predicted branched-subunit amino acid permease